LSTPAAFSSLDDEGSREWHRTEIDCNILPQNTAIGFGAEHLLFGIPA
jgi:hypothetical protein